MYNIWNWILSSALFFRVWEYAFVNIKHCSYRFSFKVHARWFTNAENKAINYVHKTYVYTLFETFSNQPLWELREIVKKITGKTNAL